jgi:hypothetical protein
MREWPIVDRRGFADLRLGDRRAVVRERFGEFRVFRRTPDSAEADQFLPSGLMVTYGADGGVAFIEIPPPANPTIQGVALIGRPLTDVRGDLAAHGIAFVADSAAGSEGGTIDGWDVGLWIPDDVVRSVSIGQSVPEPPT